MTVTLTIVFGWWMLVPVIWVALVSYIAVKCEIPLVGFWAVSILILTPVVAMLLRYLPWSQRTDPIALWTTQFTGTQSTNDRM